MSAGAGAKASGTCQEAIQLVLLWPFGAKCNTAGCNPGFKSRLDYTWLGVYEEGVDFVGSWRKIYVNLWCLSWYLEGYKALSFCQAALVNISLIIWYRMSMLYNDW